MIYEAWVLAKKLSAETANERERDEGGRMKSSGGTQGSTTGKKAT